MSDETTANWPDFLLAIFSGNEAASPMFFGADFMREVVVAVFIFLIGWAAAQRSAGKHKKTHLANELITVHQRLLDSAYPAAWSSTESRQVRDFASLMMHLDFASGMMTTDNVLNEKQDVALERYIGSVSDFIHVWADTRYRYQSYHTSFANSLDRLEDLLREISSAKRLRWRALLRDYRARSSNFTTNAHASPDEPAEQQAITSPSVSP